MLEGLDAHSGYLSARELHAVDGYAADKLVGIGVELAANPGGATIVSTMPGSPARLAGFAAGDMITAIDTSPVAGAGLMQIIQRLGGKPGTDVAVTLRRAADGATVERTLQRTALQGETVEHRLMGDVGYLKILSFADDTETGLRRAYAALLAEGGDKLRGLVIDLRNDFLVSGLVVSMRPRHAEDTVKIEAHGSDITGGRPLVVLINEATASAAEIVAAALQDHRRAIVLGVRSFGKGSVQTITPLDDDAGAIRLTTALYYTPSGRSIQARGITPDVEVRSEFASGKVVREADLPGSLRTADADRPAEPRADLPAAIAAIPRVPPDAWPVSPTHSLEQDFQAQQAIRLLRLVTGGLPQAATGSLIHVTTEAGSAR
jgi:carboxyl-terminal processing protease